MRALAALLLAFLLLLAAAPSAPTVASDGDSDGAVIQGVLFVSPACGHCEQVIAGVLPGIYDQFGGAPTISFDHTLPDGHVAFYLMANDELELLLVDTSVEAGARMFAADGQRLGLAQAGVPRLDIGERYLVGSFDIPAQLPGIIEAGLAGAGIGWSAVPGISDALATTGPRASVVAPIVAADPGRVGQGDSVLDRINRDPLGNGLSILMFMVMLASLALVPVLVARGSLRRVPRWAVPVFVLVGMSLYLGTIETTGAEAVCGPVGDCNAVQRSEYAAILDVPIGVLGVVAYAGLGLAWLFSRATTDSYAAWATVALAAMALAGTLFSVYLTFLEPFVIGATCIWCLT